MTITAAQVTALTQSAEGRFHVWLAGWLRAMVPEATTTLDPAGLAKRILDGLALARSYGIAGRRALAQFMAVDVLVGPALLDEPVVRRFLETEEVPAGDKPALLLEALAAQPPERMVRQTAAGDWLAAIAVVIAGAGGPAAREVAKHIANAPPPITDQPATCVGACPQYAKPKEPQSEEDRLKGANAPGIPTDADGFKPKKGWNGTSKARNPYRPGYGYPAQIGAIWIPTGPSAHGGPHWDVEYPNGDHDNIVPGGKKRGEK